jgi:hypothetical protein
MVIRPRRPPIGSSTTQPADDEPAVRRTLTTLLVLGILVLGTQCSGATRTRRSVGSGRPTRRRPLLGNLEPLPARTPRGLRVSTGAQVLFRPRRRLAVRRVMSCDAAHHPLPAKQLPYLPQHSRPNVAPPTEMSNPLLDSQLTLRTVAPTSPAHPAQHSLRLSRPRWTTN